MSIFDLLSGGNESESAGQVAPPGLAALLGSMGGQQPTDTTPASGTGLPPRSPVDNSMVIPLMLMRAAAEVSARRAPGQSHTNQNITALYNAGLAGMQLKGDNEDRALKERKAQLEETVTSQNLSAAQQQQQQSSELHPLKVMAARLGISEEEAKLKVAQTQAKYAEEHEKARIELAQATTAEKQANASKRLADIEAQQRKLDILMAGQNVQGQRLQLAADKLEIDRRKAEESQIRVHTNPTTGQTVYSWQANGDQFVQEKGMSEIDATKETLKLIESRKALAKSLNQPWVEPTAQQVQNEIKFKMSDKNYRRGPTGELEAINKPVAPGQAPAPTAPAAGKPSGDDTLPLTTPQLENIKANLAKAPPNTGYKDDQGRVWRSDPNSRHAIRLVPPEELQGTKNAPQAPAQQSVSVPAAFEQQLRKAPDATLKGPDGKLYMYNSSKKVVELVGDEKPYKRLFEP